MRRVDRHGSPGLRDLAAPLLMRKTIAVPAAGFKQ
jgi:hypothetical protein